jgi:hypothetical protein
MRDILYGMRSKFPLALLLAVLLASAAPASADDESPLKLETQQADPEALMNFLRQRWEWLTDQAPRATTSEPRAVRPLPSQTQRSEPLTTVRAPRPVGPCSESELDREETRELQALLNEILSEGDEPGSMDGLCGPRTVRAIQAFEVAQGHAEKGVPTRTLLAEIREVGATVANRAIMQPVQLPGDPALWRRQHADLPALASQPAEGSAGPTSTLPGDPALWQQ